MRRDSYLTYYCQSHLSHTEELLHRLRDDAFLHVCAGFYTTWLLPAALVGTLVFLSGLTSMNSNPEACVLMSQRLFMPEKVA